MYQINFSICEEKAYWIESILDVLQIKLFNKSAIMACNRAEGRFNVSVASENNKGEINEIIKECLIDMFISTVKKEYLSLRLCKTGLKENSKEILLHTLVAFDRENERGIIGENLDVVNMMAVDGIFNFKLSELKTRWNEIALLATENAGYLSDEETLNDLLRFLISAINPKIPKLKVKQENNMYNIIGEISECVFEYNIYNTEQLMYYLIDTAPVELNLTGKFSDEKLIKRLICIFDAKIADNCHSGFVIK